MPRRPLRAWIDESVRIAGAEPPVYVLGGPVADPGACDAHRAALRRLHRTSGKLHWRELDPSHRRAAIAVVRDSGLRHVVVIGRGVDPKRQERARALCLERLSWSLDNEHAVALALLEARTGTQMQRDLDLINAFQSRGVLSDALRMRHEQPSVEPMLWIADVVVGAVGDAHVGRTGWLDALADTVHVIEIEV